MTMRGQVRKLVKHDDINFMLTNRWPRRALSRLFGRFSRIEQPLIRDFSIAVWRLFSDLDLAEAETRPFRSLRDCFTRRLKPGSRPIDRDPDILVSPCDAIVGAHGPIAGTRLYQIKGRDYPLEELLGDKALADAHHHGCYVTLRLTSSMYHRFHAPHDCLVEAARYIPGDAWNVNPPALKRVDRLYCRNERAVLQATLGDGAGRLTIVPVGAILVAGIRLNFIELGAVQKTRQKRLLACHARFSKGEEMGWFEHGSTIVLLAPHGFAFCPNVREGGIIRMGEPLLRASAARRGRARPAESRP